MERETSKIGKKKSKKKHISKKNEGSFKAVELPNDIKTFCMKKGDECGNALVRMYELIDGWTHGSGRDLHTGIVHHQYFKEYGRRVYRLQGIVKCSAKRVWEDNLLGIEEVPEWNPTITECRSIAPISENTDICYNVTAEAAGGLVSSRDFTNVRHWHYSPNDDCYFSAVASVELEEFPVLKKHVRGVNYPCGMVTKPCPEKPEHCIFTFFLNSDIKGWIPKSVIEIGLSGFLLHYFKYLTEHCEHLEQEHDISS